MPRALHEELKLSRGDLSEIRGTIEWAYAAPEWSDNDKAQMNALQIELRNALRLLEEAKERHG